MEPEHEPGDTTTNKINPNEDEMEKITKSKKSHTLEGNVIPIKERLSA
jgi:hypothetical protein